MPGLVGFITPRLLDHHASMLAGMLQSMEHEPFYRSGSYMDSTVGVGIGWICHPGGYDDCLPVWNEARDICLVFSGEHFPASSEAAGMRAAGHRCETDDATALVHLYETSGADFVRGLNGAFCGIVIDLRIRQVVVFNDRYGLGRLYLYDGGGTYYFSSEAKAIFRAVPTARRLDWQGFGELLVCGCTLQHRSLFSGVVLLPPASCWTFSTPKRIERRHYFTLDAWENQTRLGVEEYYLSLKEVFTRILPRYFRGPQAVALSLTGGLDSRMIIAGIGRPAGDLPCYTFGGTYRECADVKLARRIAALNHQPHSVIPVDSHFFPRFIALAERCVYITDGNMDVTGSVGLYANRWARQIAPVRMTGNYGSEILRANIAFKAGVAPVTGFAPELAPYLKRAQETFASERANQSRLSFILGKQVPWHHYARLAEEQSQLTIRAPYLDNELVPLAYRAPAESLTNKELAYRYTTDMRPALAHLPTDRGALSCPRFVPRRLFETALELLPHVEYRFDYGMPNWLAKLTRTATGLDRLFLGHQKYYHFRTWYRHELASQVKDVLLDPRTLSRALLNRREIERIVESHTKGTANHTLAIHKLLTFELIQRQLLDPQSEPSHATHLSLRQHISASRPA